MYTAFAQYFVEAPLALITASNIFGYDVSSFDKAYFQVSPDIFDWVQSQALARYRADTELMYSYSYLLKCPDTKRQYHTACDKCHIQTKKHTTE